MDSRVFYRCPQRKITSELTEEINDVTELVLYFAKDSLTLIFGENLRLRKQN